MKKVNLLKAHCTFCLGSQITHISEGQHTGHCVGVCQKHTHMYTHIRTLVRKQTHTLLLSGERLSACCLKRCGSSWQGLKQLVEVQHLLYLCCLLDQQTAPVFIFHLIYLLISEKQGRNKINNKYTYPGVIIKA